MRAPSFRCTEREEDGATVLHYYSEREGLEHIVIGIVKVVASTLHKADVEVEILKAKGEDCDHVQFVIIEKEENKNRTTKAELDAYEDTLSKEAKISPATFCRAFPFHVMFDRQMNIVQAGSSITRVIPQMNEESRINDLFEMIRPHMEFDFYKIQSHINTVYVLRTIDGALEGQKNWSREGSDQESSQMRLKGEMLYVPESECMLFLCSPSVMNLDDLNKRGLYLSDIPLHDATRDLVLLSEQFEAEYKLTQNLEILTDQLQQTYVQLQDERNKTDK